MEREFKIKVNSSYESCDNCIRSNDTEEICKMRGCIHALTENDIKDYYQPKESRKAPKGFPNGMTNGEFIREMLTTFLRREG